MKYIRNIWYPILNSDEVTPGARLGVTVAERKVVVFRREGGELAALEDRCSHRFAPLSVGRVMGENIMCMYHGLKFGSSGACVAMPGQDLVKGFDIQAFAVAEQSGVVWIWMGEASLADPAKIPVNPLFGEGLLVGQGVIDYACDYQLINDNLTDFSHVTFVHENTVGRNLDEWAQRHPDVKSLDDGVQITRWIVDQGQLPLPGHPPKVDLWQKYDYLIPGVLRMWMEYYPVGTAERLGYAEPDSTRDAPIYTSYFFQTAAPTIRNHTRFLWGIAVPEKFGSQAHDMTVAIVQMAFEEDKRMIEAQQVGIDTYLGLPLRNTAHDGALMRVRRLIQKAIREEQSAIAEPVAAE